MGKKFDRSKKLFQIFVNILYMIKQLQGHILEESDENLKKILTPYIAVYSLVNIHFDRVIAKIVSESAKTDIIDAEFNEIIKGLKDDKKEEK